MVREKLLSRRNSSIQNLEFRILFTDPSLKAHPRGAESIPATSGGKSENNRGDTENSINVISNQ